jgi:hypothetical protein
MNLVLLLFKKNVFITSSYLLELTRRKFNTQVNIL